MELLKSKKFTLPVVYYVTDKKEIEDIPIGVPYIYGKEDIKDSIIRILEYELLYERAKKTGLPFKFKEILRDNGYDDLTDFYYSEPAYIDYKKDNIDYELIDDYIYSGTSKIEKGASMFSQFIRDTAVYVDIKQIKNLNIFPIWLDNIENAVKTNIHNFAIYNPLMYNKRLEGMYGGMELVSPGRSLIVIDISSSIPKAISSAILALGLHMGETLYADILITGSISTLYPYEDIYKLDVNTIYETNGLDNDQTYFKALVSTEERVYKTAIVFGDNHSPCHCWNHDATKMTIAEGKAVCKWRIDKLISFHTRSDNQIAGYAEWFSPKEIEYIKNWVKYLA